MRDILILFKFVFPDWKKYWRLELSILFLLTVMMGVQIYTPKSFQVLIDSLSLFDSSSTFYTNLWVFTGLILASILLGWLFQYLVTYLGESLIIDITSRCYTLLLKRKKSFWINFSPNDVLTRLTQDILSVKSIVIDFFHNAIYQIVYIIGTMIVLYFMSEKVFYVVLISMPFLFLVSYFGNTWLNSVANKTRILASGFMQLFYNGLKSPPINHSWDLNSYHLSKYRSHAENMKKTQLDYIFINRKINFLSSFFSLLFSTVFVLIVLRMDYLQGGYTSGELMALIIYSGRATDFIVSFASMLVTTKLSRVSSLRIKEINDFEDYKTDVIRPSDKKYVHPFFKSELKSGIQLPDKNCFLFNLKADNGTGKSTYASFLSGFDDLAGQIPDKNWILLSSDPLIIEGTVLDNIRIFTKIEWSESEVVRHLTSYKLENLLRLFPAGVNTPIFESEEIISRGQKQAVALISAILKNPETVIIDEGLNSLDQAIKAEIKDGLFAWMAERKTVVIEHDNYFNS